MLGGLDWQRPGVATDAEPVCIGPAALPGTLELPQRPIGLIVFAQCHPSRRASQQNQFLARVWRAYGLGSLQFDLCGSPARGPALGPAGIASLGQRLAAVLTWVWQRAELCALPVGLFGVGVGAAAALCVAATEPRRIGAVVSSAGRPDLAQPLLPRVRTPTLLIVGQRDPQPLESSNRAALRALQCTTRLEVIPQASHLPTEAGALDVIVSLAGHWFEQHLSRADPDGAA